MLMDSLAYLECFEKQSDDIRTMKSYWSRGLCQEILGEVPLFCTQQDCYY